MLAALIAGLALAPRERRPRRRTSGLVVLDADVDPVTA